MIQYKKKDLVDIVMQINHKYDVDPHDIELEIIESVLIDNFLEN